VCLVDKSGDRQMPKESFFVHKLVITPVVSDLDIGLDDKIKVCVLFFEA